MDIAFESENWIIREVFNHVESVKWGREQWCTACSDPSHYNSLYSAVRGRLLIFFKRDKRRPQYQLFQRHRDGQTEFRDGGNLYADLRVFATSNAELTEWLTCEVIDKIQKIDVSAIPNHAAELWYPPVGLSRGLFNVNAERTIYSRNEADDALADRIENARLGVPLHFMGLVHGEEERNAINALTGAMCIDVDSNTTYIYNGQSWDSISRAPQP